jgi:hypothetical protein
LENVDFFSFGSNFIEMDKSLNLLSQVFVNSCENRQKIAAKMQIFFSFGSSFIGIYIISKFIELSI